MELERSWEKGKGRVELEQSWGERETRLEKHQFLDSAA